MFFHLQILLITVWSMGAISLLFTLYTRPPVSDSQSHFASLSLFLAILTSLGWTLLNLTMKFEIWRGPTKIAELASKLLTTERELLSMGIPASWMFKVRAFRMLKKGQSYPFYQYIYILDAVSSYLRHRLPFTFTGYELMGAGGQYSHDDEPIGGHL